MNPDFQGIPPLPGSLFLLERPGRAAKRSLQRLPSPVPVLGRGWTGQYFHVPVPQSPQGTIENSRRFNGGQAVGYPPMGAPSFARFAKGGRDAVWASRSTYALRLSCAREYADCEFSDLSCMDLRVQSRLAAQGDRTHVCRTTLRPSAGK